MSRDCNAKTLAMLDSCPAGRLGANPNFQRAVDKFAHLIAARQIWLYRLGRWPERPTTFFPAGTTLADLPARLKAIEEAWTTYLAKLDDSTLLSEFPLHHLYFRPLSLECPRPAHPGPLRATRGTTAARSPRWSRTWAASRLTPTMFGWCVTSQKLEPDARHEDAIQISRKTARELNASIPARLRVPNPRQYGRLAWQGLHDRPCPLEVEARCERRSGKLITLTQIRTSLAKKARVDQCCPLTTTRATGGQGLEEDAKRGQEAGHAVVADGA